MTLSEIIKNRLNEINMTQTELATKLNSTRQNFNNKMSRDNFTAKELTTIADILGLQVLIKDNSGKEYIIEYVSNEEETSSEN